MPNRSDVRPTSHDRHDPLLVAALAAGDLAATDRVHATQLIETCGECATLHDDLIAIARATASVPPPIATRPRDFRLTPEQAKRLQPSGWRRLLGGLAGPRLAFAKPLGIGLTTIGLAGLLLGNISLSFGSAASAPMSVSTGAGGGVANEAAASAAPAYGAGSEPGSQFGPMASSPTAPQAAASAPAASAAASGAAGLPEPTDTAVRGRASSPPASGAAAIDVAGGVKSTSPASSQAPREAAGQGDRLSQVASGPDPRTVIFVAAIVIGLGLLVLGRIARRVTTS
jgi:hypothetical protein